jgi:hypothetical protein
VNRGLSSTGWGIAGGISASAGSSRGDSKKSSDRPIREAWSEAGAKSALTRRIGGTPGAPPSLRGCGPEVSSVRIATNDLFAVKRGREEHPRWQGDYDGHSTFLSRYPSAQALAFGIESTMYRVT